MTQTEQTLGLIEAVVAIERPYRAVYRIYSFLLTCSVIIHDSSWHS